METEEVQCFETFEFMEESGIDMTESADEVGYRLLENGFMSCMSCKDLSFHIIVLGYHLA